MRVVEGNQISQRSHVCVRERGEVLRDLRLEFIQERCELVIGVREYVTCISVYNSCTEAFHYAQRVLRKRDRLLVARNAAAEVAVIEKAHIASDPRTVERTALEKLRVIVGKLMPDHRAKWRLQRAEKDRNIGDAARHRPSCVLLMSDWNNAVLRNKSPRRFQAHDVLNGRWACGWSIVLHANHHRR